MAKGSTRNFGDGFVHQSRSGVAKVHARDRKKKLLVFSSAFRLQMDKNGDTVRSLLAAIEPHNIENKRNALNLWRRGGALPRFGSSFTFLKKVEKRYGLKEGYFRALVTSPESETAKLLKSLRPGDQKIFRWHLPSSFEDKSPEEQAEIVGWIKSNVLGSSTEYGEYLRMANRSKYGIRFPAQPYSRSQRPAKDSRSSRSPVVGVSGGYGNVDAPKPLTGELSALISFKTEVMPPPKLSRYLRWSEASARLAVSRYGQLFGALGAAPQSQPAGLGLPLNHLSFGLLIFPAVWNWYFGWRERRRGFFTFTEQNLLYEIKSLSRDPTGWLRQNRALAKRVRAVPGLVSKKEAEWARKNWDKANDKLFRFACDRIPEMLRAKRQHRDPFLPILPVLNADSPLAEYKRVADEILRQLSFKKQTPNTAAHALRSYLLMRLTIHLGVRQRNLRELLLCKRGESPRSEKTLQQLRRGELSWNERAGAWEVTIPAIAFKNGRSQFFRDRPFKLLLPDLDRLNFWIDTYIAYCRPVILGPAPDPGTFFVKSPRATSSSAELDLFSFYEAWKYTIQRYGIYNPFTGRGAIRGLLPHGPHCVRDVLATHVLKQTGSYELASFAVQDTVEAVKRHYSRFLPHEKVARAAEVLNRVWR